MTAKTEIDNSKENYSILACKEALSRLREVHFNVSNFSIRSSFYCFGKKYLQIWQKLWLDNEKINAALRKNCLLDIFRNFRILKLRKKYEMQSIFGINLNILKKALYHEKLKVEAHDPKKN